jgi:hypothetical protein
MRDSIPHPGEDNEAMVATERENRPLAEAVPVIVCQ